MNDAAAVCAAARAIVFFFAMVFVRSSDKNVLEAM